MSWSCARCARSHQGVAAWCAGCGRVREQKQQESSGGGICGRLGSAFGSALRSLSGLWGDVPTSSSPLDPILDPLPAPSAAAAAPSSLSQPASYNIFDLVAAKKVSASRDAVRFALSPVSPDPTRVLKLTGLSDAAESEWEEAGDYSVFTIQETPARTPVRSPASPQPASALCQQIGHDEHEAVAKLEQIERRCRKSGTSFIDDEFPHKSRESIGLLYDHGSKRWGFAANTIWLRPHQLRTEDDCERYPYTMIREAHSIADIKQGRIGNCWFLSVLGLIAERSEILDKILVTKEYNSLGVYQIRLCVDGLWRVITVDDYLPCCKGTRTLLFSRCRRNQLWVPLVEKAYAKALGTYGAMHGGKSIKALALLTGAPCETIHLEEEEIDTDLVWARLLSAKEAGYIIGTNCGNSELRRLPKAVSAFLGLASQHCYGVVDVRKEREFRLVRIRNPWGESTWRGAWSDHWMGWPADLKRRLLPAKSSGDFWISLEDLCLHFECIDFAKVRQHSPWEELRLPCRVGGTWAEDALCLALRVDQLTEMSVSLLRSASGKVVDFEDLMICVHRVNPEGTVGELMMSSRSIFCDQATTREFFIESGHYVIIPLSLRSFNQGKFRFQATLVVHSNKPLSSAEQISCTPTMAADALVELVLKNGRLQTQSSDSGTLRSLPLQLRGSLFMVDNLDRAHDLLVIINCGLASDTRPQSSAAIFGDFTVPPRSRQMLLFLSCGGPFYYKLTASPPPPSNATALPSAKPPTTEDTAAAQQPLHLLFSTVAHETCDRLRPRLDSCSILIEDY